MYYPLPLYPVYRLPSGQAVYQVPGYYAIPGQRHFPAIRQQYPEADPTLFHESAGAFKQLMKVGTVLLNKLTASKEFAQQVMDAAQRGDKEKVKQLIQSTGIKEKVDVDYNPDGITFNMFSKVEKVDCCKLAMSLRWR
ncbi:hypothetical protein F3157_10800 [Virgibacillus dakarensis]|nr:hypothetical protein [Virgibacillus dakarensis]